MMGASSAQRMVEAWNSGNVEKIGEMYATGRAGVAPDGP
jgi:hypothetical protein